MTNMEYLELRVKYSKMLKFLRSEKNVSQKTVARYLGVTRKAVWNWENTIQVPSAYSAYRLAIFYGVPYEIMCCVPPKNMTPYSIENPMSYNLINFSEKELQRFVKRAMKKRIDSVDFYL